MKYYQTPNTQIVRLSSGEDVLTDTSFSVASGGGGIQSSAMAPRRAATPKIP